VLKVKPDTITTINSLEEYLRRLVDAFLNNSDVMRTKFRSLATIGLTKDKKRLYTEVAVLRDYSLFGQVFMDIFLDKKFSEAF